MTISLLNMMQYLEGLEDSHGIIQSQPIFFLAHTLDSTFLLSRV